ncbi:MAG: TetR/AcrR family transcriptional regulator [Eubacteriales bacterium]|nr:TetR/AcrR family transcriptional regulator [Eubacteriales bacterium]
MRKGDQRRQAIIEAAEALFYKNGYEGTSVQDVLDVLKLSKGGFYHHFDSKLRLLEAICAQKVETACVFAQKALENAGEDALEQLNALLSHIGLLNQDNLDFVGLIIRVAYAGEGALLRDSLKRGYIEQLLPVTKQVVAAGLKQGVFFTLYPDRLAELLLNLGACLTDELGFALALDRGAPECTITVFEKLNAYRHAVETLLGAPYGSVQMYDMSKLISILKELGEQEKRLESMENSGISA